MHPQSSSTSSSEAPDATLGGAFKTLAWIASYLIAFEVLIAVSPKIPRFGEKLHHYFEYGRSAESKLRAIAAIPNLPRSDVFNVGWLEPSRWAELPNDVDLAIYGMSYAANIGLAMNRVRPDLKVRMVGGPGMPLSHSYTAYQLDRPQRKARVVMISMLTSGVRDLLGMTHDTLYTDHTTPVFYPRYRAQDGHAIVAANPVIGSDDQLRDALLRDPALWQRNLETLAEHDVNARLWIYSTNWTEATAIGRMARRGYATGRRLEFIGPLPGREGYQRDHEASQVARALLRDFIRDVRNNGETPVMVLFAEFGAGRSLHGLVGDILAETKTPFVDSDVICSSFEAANYQNLHLTHACDDLVAQQVLKLLSETQEEPNP